MTIAWWTGRYALVTAVFAAAALLFHTGWCRKRRPLALSASLLAATCALLSGESGLQTFALLFAYTVVRTRVDLKRWVAELAPATALLFTYLITWSALGFGVSESALYVSPISEAAAYLQNVVTRFHPVLVATILNYAAPISVQLVALAAAALIVAGLARKPQRPMLMTFAWLAVGITLTLAPCFGGRNAFRSWTLVIPQIGAQALLGLLLAAPWLEGAGTQPGSVARKLGAVVLGFCCLVLPTLDAWSVRASWNQASNTPAALAKQFPPETRAAIAAGKSRLVFLSSPRAVMPVNRLQLWHGLEDIAAGQTSTIVLSGAGFLKDAQVTVTRTSQDTLLMKSTHPLVRANDVFRFDDRKPMPVGHTITLPNLTVTIREVREQVGRPVSPTAAEFMFPTSLDDDQYLFLKWVDGRYVVVPPLREGQSIEL